MIEVELRSFLDDVQHARLRVFLDAHAEFCGEEEQVTIYLDCPQDLRIQKSDSTAKLWLKTGALHDETREEHEVRIPPEEFETLRSLLAQLGYGEEVVWLRTRRTYLWDGVTVTLDDTRGYGKIIELELLVDGDPDEARTSLRERFARLGIEPTPKERFAEAYERYRKNWQELLRGYGTQ